MYLNVPLWIWEGVGAGVGGDKSLCASVGGDVLLCLEGNSE